MGKKKFVINEEACRARGDSEETIKLLKKETRKLMRSIEKEKT